MRSFSTLRRVLGADGDLIKNIPGRSYVLAFDLMTNSIALALARAEASNPASSIATEKLGAIYPIPLQRPIGSKMSAPGQASPIIAVLDDDRNIRDAIQDLLQSAGLCIELFASTEEFLETSHAKRYACLVLDVRLPGQSGLDFHDELLVMDYKLPVVFISGHADVPIAVRTMKAGAIDFLTKPVFHRDMLDAVQRAIRSRP